MATFTGLNVVKVAGDVQPGDLLVAVPPTKADTVDKNMARKHVGAVCSVLSYRDAKNKYGAGVAPHKFNTLIIGRCVGGARRGFNATGELSPPLSLYAKPS